MSDTDPYVVSTDARVVDAALAAAPDIVLAELELAVLECQLLLEREVKERAPTSGAGTLRDSIGTLPLSLSGTALSGTVGTPLSYAVPVELGSRPHRPPIAPLAEWVDRKLGIKGKAGQRVAWAIAGKIAKRGTPAHHMFGGALEAHRAQIGEIAQGAVERAMGRIGS